MAGEAELRNAKWSVGVVGALLLLATAFPSTAGPLDQRIVAIGFSYQPAEITLAQGEPLEFTNLDVAPHDVTALDAGPDGLPLFASETIGTAATSAVDGLDDLPTGVYDFTCTLHPEMIGTLFLEAADG